MSTNTIALVTSVEELFPEYSFVEDGKSVFGFNIASAFLGDSKKKSKSIKASSAELARVCPWNWTISRDKNGDPPRVKYKTKARVVFLKTDDHKTYTDITKDVVGSDQYRLGLQPPLFNDCLLYTSPSPRDQRGSRMPSSA